MSFSATSALKTQLDTALERGQFYDAELFCQDLIAELETDLNAHKDSIKEAFFSMSSILESQGKDGTSFRTLGQALSDSNGRSI